MLSLSAAVMVTVSFFLHCVSGEDAQAMMAKAGAQSAGSGLGFQAKNLIDRPEKSWRPVVIILLAQVPMYQSPSTTWHGCTVFSLLVSRAC